MSLLTRQMLTALAAVLCLALIAGPANAQTFTVGVASEDGDAEEQYGAGVTDGSMESLTSSDLELGSEGSQSAGGRQQIVGVRFLGIPFPQGARIQSAFIQFAVDNTSSPSLGPTGTGDARPFNLRIHGELPQVRGGVAQPPKAYERVDFNISRRPQTTEFVDWLVPVWVDRRDTIGQEQGPDQRTPNLAAIVQEIINDAGWTEGDPMAFMLAPEPFDQVDEREAESWDAGAPQLAPQLTITLVPEPSTMVMAVAGLLGLFFQARRRRSHRRPAG